MNPIVMITIGWLIMAAVMILFWFVQRRTGDSGIVDVVWGMGVSGLAVFFAAGSDDGDVNRRIATGLLAMLWAVRLSGHVLLRVLTMPEDGRYRTMKETWGDQAQSRMFRFYQFQAAGSLLFALPMLAAAQNPLPWRAADTLGCFIWLTAIIGEAIADRQLAKFRSAPLNQGKVCQHGLWRYSRHPNYFFEWLHWWTYVALASGTTAGWFTILGPLTMLYFITKVTGIPPTEAQSLKSRGAAYRDYQRTTSAFFPWFPRDFAVSMAIELVERGWVPDSITRAAMRRLLAQRLASLDTSDAARAAFIRKVSEGPVALVPGVANDQHYEVSADFFARTLGSHRKYSSCVWSEPQMSLDQAEAAALQITCERAEITDGQQILELGCGWGSLTLWMAEHYPHARITAVSNSHSQREFITAEAVRRGLSDRVMVVTADMNEFAPAQTFDRIVSIEMFEHMHNHAELLRRISTWMKPDGRLFVHVFCHRNTSYEFCEQGASDWMSRYFFTGGMMPSVNLLPGYDKHLQLTQSWDWNGQHYRRTLDAWLNRMDDQRTSVMSALAQTYGVETAARWFQRWRMFFMACSELFGYRKGTEWFVAHYLFTLRT